MSDIIATAAMAAYDLAYQVSPIILYGGLYPAGMPIIGLTGELAGLVQGVISNGISADDFFARFLVLPGGTLINQTIATYPFASQQVAANATIQQPKNISLRMICPAKGAGYYLTKTAILTSLQNTLEQHNAAGGYYTVATPGFVYTNCILTAWIDITPANTKNPQTEFQLDFVAPLITQEQAGAALNSLLNKVGGGSVVTSSSYSDAASASAANGSGTVLGSSSTSLLGS